MAQGPNQLLGIGYLVLIFVVFYFLFIRPQQRRAKEHRALVSETKVGDRVVTIGGIHGTVKAVEDETIRLEVAQGTEVTLSKSAIASRQSE